jgi:DEAD/DEAH box helicase domain-containing protein
MVVGYNLINFDYEVLQKYTVLDLASVVPTLDLLVEIEKRLKARVPLDAVASASLGVGKTADGLQAITWWRQGKILEIAEYCCFDVKCTKLVHEFGIQNKKIFYENRSRQRCELAVDWP